MHTRNAGPFAAVRRAMFASVLIIGGCASENAIIDGVEVDGGMVDAGASVQSQDSLPAGAVSFFRRSACPVGWEAFALGAGRTVVPSIGRDPVGNTQGEVLASGEDRQHVHRFMGDVTTDSVSYIGIAGEANHGLGRSGTYALSLAGEASSSGIPYVQQLICRKVGAPHPQRAAAPSGTLMFFSTSACPPGWAQPPLSQGRYLVGLPVGGKTGLAFGSPSLMTTEARRHQHAAEASFQTESHGIALASGSGAGGYVKDSRYTFQATSTQEAVDFPFVQLLQCQKQ